MFCRPRQRRITICLLSILSILSPLDNTTKLYRASTYVHFKEIYPVTCQTNNLLTIKTCAPKLSPLRGPTKSDDEYPQKIKQTGYFKANFIHYLRWNLPKRLPDIMNQSQLSLKKFTRTNNRQQQIKELTRTKNKQRISRFSITK